MGNSRAEGDGLLGAEMPHHVHCGNISDSDLHTADWRPNHLISIAVSVTTNLNQASRTSSKVNQN